ncbi:MAG: TonB-dependent receptor plug domain-containing protein [Bacteroidetes bacterium]|nr:TonB-dependent receptor plug domain-containing protein [Bacteroidota bacterium]
MKKLLLAGIALLLSTFLFSQKITGKITDTEGSPLPGATVMLIETQEGTMANGQGDFELSPSQSGNYTLKVSFVGYEPLTRTIVVPSAMPLQITLESSVNLLQTLTVTAVRAGEKSPFTYTNVSSEALHARNLGQDVPYLLDATPSVVTTSDAGAGVGYTGIRIRGTDASRINVTINGVPLNEAESQAVYWVDLPDVAASTESIQIQRGVGTSTNGSGAFGASINLNTSELEPSPYLIATATYGSFNTQKASLKFGSGLLGLDSTSQNTGFTVDARGSQISSDGYIDRASSKLRSAYLSPAYIGKKFTLRGIVLHGDERTYQAWYGLPAQFIDDEKLRTYNPAGTETSGTPYPDQVDDYRQTHTQLIYNQELNANWHFNLTGHYTRGLGYYEEYKNQQDICEYGYPTDFCPTYDDLVRRRWLDNHFFGGIGVANFQSDNHRLQMNFGGAANRYLGKHYGTVVKSDNFIFNPGQRYYDDRGNKTDLSVFSKLQYGFTSQLSGLLDLQFRQVNYEIIIKEMAFNASPNYKNTTSNYSFFNPKAGLFYEANKKLAFYTSFAVGQKEPNRDDFTDAPTGKLPKAERLYNTEVGAKFIQEKLALGLNFYHMFYKDQLVLTGNINDSGEAVRINVPDSYRAGVELTARAVVEGHFVVDGNATFSKNKIKNFTEYVDNWDTGGQEAFDRGTTDIALSPNVVAFGRLTWGASQNFAKNGQGLSISVASKHVGKQYLDNTSNENTVLDAYTTFEAQLRYSLHTSIFRELSINLLVQNLLDARYSSNAWTYRYISGEDYTMFDTYARSEGGNFYNLTGYYPQAGRNFLLAFTIGF